MKALCDGQVLHIDHALEGVIKTKSILVPIALTNKLLSQVVLKSISDGCLSGRVGIVAHMTLSLLCSRDRQANPS